MKTELDMRVKRCERCHREITHPMAKYGPVCAKILGIDEQYCPCALPTADLLIGPAHRTSICGQSVTPHIF